MRLIGIINLIVGLLLIAEAIFNWDWFMEIPKFKLIYLKIWGREGVRAWLFIMGIVIVFLGIIILVKFD